MTSPLKNSQKLRISKIKVFAGMSLWDKYWTLTTASGWTRFTCDSEDGLPLVTSHSVLSGAIVFSSIILLYIGKVQSSILCTGPSWQQLISHTQVDWVQCHGVISLLQPKHLATNRACYFDSPPMYLSSVGSIADCACAFPRPHL